LPPCLHGANTSNAPFVDVADSRTGGVVGHSVRVDAIGLVRLERVERSYRYRALERVALLGGVDAAHFCAL
jgi:hypothetical protein